ncbi:hypothetical protein PFISCL1PPCAC_24348, partial [Pristionchus fissidentatus]
MLPFAALIAFASSIAFVVLCGGGNKYIQDNGGGPAVKKNEIAATVAGECPKDTVADVPSNWG